MTVDVSTATRVIFLPMKSFTYSQYRKLSKERLMAPMELMTLVVLK